MNQNEEQADEQNWYADGMVKVGKCIFALGAGAAVMLCLQLFSAVLQ